jgi:hypothetical protein
MRRRLGTSMTLVLAFALLAALSQGVAYQVSSDLCWAPRCATREIDKIETISRVIERLIKPNRAYTSSRSRN